MLLAADYPVLLTEYAARAPIGFDDTVELAETVGSAVFDIITNPTNVTVRINQ